MKHSEPKKIPDKERRRQVQEKLLSKCEIRDGNGKRHIRIGCFRPDPKLHEKDDAFIVNHLEACIKEYPLIKLLRDVSCVIDKCGQDVDFSGFIMEAAGDCAISLPALCHIASTALRLTGDSGLTASDELYLKNHTIENSRKECFLPVLPLCLAFNSFTAKTSHIFSDDIAKLLQISAPILYAQERYTLTQRQLMARCMAWYHSIPKDSNYNMPSVVSDYIKDQYGVGGDELAIAAFYLYTAASMCGHLISDRTFGNTKDPNNHPAHKLLKYSKPISGFCADTLEETIGAKCCRSSSTALLVKHPIVHLRDDTYSIPIPRLVLNTLVETIHWNLFDYFKTIFSDPRNIYTEWFGDVFQKYITNILCRSFTRKMQPEIIYDIKTNDRSSDLLEIHMDRALLIEVKSRRPLLLIKQFDSPEAMEKLKKFAEKTVQQVVNYIDKHCCDDDRSPLALKSVNKYLIVVITPEWWPANPVIADGLLDAMFKKCTDIHSHIHSIRACFIQVSDVEIIPQLKGHQFAYDIFEQYMNSDYYPNSSFADFIRLGAGIRKKLVNPYVDEQFRAAYELCKGMSFGK